MIKSNKLLFGFLILLLTVFVSCSVEKNRKILSVFFDGVPEPGKVTVNQIERETGVKRVPNRNVLQIVSIHPDYKKKDCSKCHKRSISSFLVTDRKKICFTCHKKEKFAGKYVHGPVAVKACNTCHAPHKSVNRKLLLEDGRKLCVLCHRIPVAENSLHCNDGNCLDCHEPHVSSNKFFLKKGIKKNIDKPDLSDNSNNMLPSQNEN